jgi:hypothetical protein
MRLGYIKEIKKNLYSTVNGKVRIRLTSRKGHIHVSVSGSKRLNVLTSVTSDLTRNELIAFASYVYRQLDHYPSERMAKPYAGVFGSLWLGGY